MISNCWRQSPVICGVVLFANLGVCGAQQAGRIVDIKLSPDQRRLVVQCEGPIGSHEVRALKTPSSLVIDLHSTQVGQAPGAMKLEHGPIREIRTVRQNSDARVVVDFGEHPVPEHKVRKIGDCLIVFLGEFGPVRAAASVPSAPGAIGNKQERVTPQAPRVQVRAPGNESPKAKLTSRITDPKQPRHTIDSTKLFVKSARVVNGSIQMEVAEKHNPRKAYLISLGVDWERLGLKTAEIRPAPWRAEAAAGQSRVSSLKATKREPRARKGIGPGKEASKKTITTVKGGTKGPSGASANATQRPAGPTRVKPL